MFGAHMVFAQPTAGLSARAETVVQSPTATRSPPGRSSSRRASPRRLGVPRLEALISAGSMVRPEARRGPWKAAMSSSGEPETPGQATLHLARHARQVTILVRGDSLARSMSDYLTREIEATANITVRLHTEITDGHGRTTSTPSPCTTGCATGQSRSRRPRCSC